MAAYAKSSAELLTNLILNGQSGQYTWEVTLFFRYFVGSISFSVFFRPQYESLHAVVPVPNTYEQL